MTFRASNILPQEAYQTVKKAAWQLNINLVSFNAQLASTGADYNFLRSIYQTLTRSNNQLTALEATPGLAAFAQAQEDDVTYNVAAEFVTLEAAIGDALLWLDTNIPTAVTLKSPGAWDDGTMVATVFSPAQTAGLQAALATVVAAIS